MVKADPWSARGFGLRLASSTVADGATIPLAQCNGITISGGQDQSPELSWAGFSDSTQSFIVTMYDPDDAHLERVLALSHSQ
jgi:phosphatidylethanolamine-binding protein (PEBP) family uncharacterized protein